MGDRENTNFNKLDRFIVVFIPIISGVLFRIVMSKVEMELNREIVNVVSIMIGVLATLLGFTITAISILLALGKNKFTKLLIESNHMYTIIIAYLFLSLWLLIALIYGVVILFTGGCCVNTYHWFVAINIVVATSFGICIFFLFGIILNTSKNM